MEYHKHCPKISVDFEFDEGNATVNYACCIHNLNMSDLVQSMKKLGVRGEVFQIYEIGRKYWFNTTTEDISKPVLEAFPNLVVLEGYKITASFGNY